MKGSWKWNLAQKLEFNWWKGYLKKSNKEDYINFKRQYWKEFLKSIGIEFKDLKGLTIYDIGCGPAGIFTIFEQSNVMAIDPLLDQYNAKLSIFQKSNYPWVQFHESIIETFKFNQQADIVFCLNVINHVIDIPTTLLNLNRANKLNGEFIVSTDAHNFKLLKWVFQLLPGDVLHPHQYSKEEYRIFIENAGFSISEEICIKRSFIFSYIVFKATKSESI